LAVGTVNFCYKLIVAVLLIPLIYLVHSWIDRYLGAELSAEMRDEARVG
jgi:uncharacterized PurR-regulated membrane protein YhhQ (DUF165 family)